ncbi:hypothetical protein [uncultured Kriegella sp.]|uniref:hypothetical protein n=1 Tax=uncultured Kriegella sp. TaxID=1798910 RepID=UPI0030DCC572|tara:strand:- start:35459 stop:35761 length:303 start_codon:yes stop_codon:yes gene_type:complete
MRTTILVLAFLAFSANTMLGQTRCADENGRPIECPPLFEIKPGILPPGPCDSCPTNLDLRKDWLFRNTLFEKIIGLPFMIAATTVKVFDGPQVKAVNKNL